MARYHLTFSIPGQRQGERQIYQAFNRTIENLRRVEGKKTDNVIFRELEVTSGSVKGHCNVEAPDYESAFQACCTNTDILDLEWHIEEVVSPEAVQRILTAAMR